MDGGRGARTGGSGKVSGWPTTTAATEASPVLPIRESGGTAGDPGDPGDGLSTSRACLNISCFLSHVFLFHQEFLIYLRIFLFSLFLALSFPCAGGVPHLVDGPDGEREHHSPGGREHATPSFPRRAAQAHGKTRAIMTTVQGACQLPQ